MGPYTKPGWKVAMGCLLAALSAIGATLFGWWLMEVMANMNLAVFTGGKALDLAGDWLIVMLCVSFALFALKGGSAVLLAHVAANVLHGVRIDLYKAMVRKEMGWHDQRDNSAGILTSTLASDVQLLNGVSSDALQV